MPASTRISGLTFRMFRPQNLRKYGAAASGGLVLSRVRRRLTSISVLAFRGIVNRDLKSLHIPDLFCSYYVALIREENHAIYTNIWNRRFYSVSNNSDECHLKSKLCNLIGSFNYIAFQLRLRTRPSPARMLTWLPTCGRRPCFQRRRIRSSPTTWPRTISRLDLNAKRSNSTKEDFVNV